MKKKMNDTAFTLNAKKATIHGLHKKEFFMRNIDTAFEKIKLIIHRSEWKRFLLLLLKNFMLTFIGMFLMSVLH